LVSQSVYYMKTLLVTRRWPALASLLFVWLFSSSPLLAQSYVCIDSSVGEFCIELFPTAAPKTVANFLNYVRGGDYDNTIIHRSLPGFVIQGGGYYYSNSSSSAVAIPKDGAVVNEFNQSNLRGTISMAKLGNDPNSATNEWFINLGNNSANLDAQNGGFTVFGRVIGNGMAGVDAIAGKSVRDLSFTLGGAFTDVPLLKIDNAITADDFVTLERVYEADQNNLPTDPQLAVTTGVFSGTVLTVPVQYRGNLYRMVFDLYGTPPNYAFRLRTTQIVQLKDIGQDRAIYRFEKLTIPTVLYGTAVLKNLVFDLTSIPNLEFTLVSYDKP